MPPPISPTVARWEIITRVKQRREEMSTTGPQIAKTLGFTSTYWSKVENEQRQLGADKFEILLDFLEFPPDERDELRQLREAGSQSGWWSQYSKIYSTDQLNLFGFEYGAEEIRDYESILIPGLLQTEEYARALIEADSIAIPAKEIERRIATRMRRQSRIGSADDAVRFVAVISEAAIAQQFGGPGVLRRQLDHLATLIRDNPDTVEVRIIPFTSRNGPIVGGCTFYLFEFPTPRLGPLAWFEAPVVAEIVSSPEKVYDLNRSFQDAQSKALTTADSLALIEESAGKLKTQNE
ncbi:Scr1 family TA system antitoxin-like transcriptional regulator [Nocardia terpenica]|uniref:Transcriptional regulator n=1 Tax=Nocardia terpenica TaxID=455432 RepID=A0A291REX5_9NOCA|nr:Scr1 family TA system antitoxin-like transcriptional regulator [Nocardia terpenica]ATL65875.1 transcriptional regulator [Nocardia terpenica]